MSVTVTGQKRHLDLNSSTLTTTGNITAGGNIILGDGQYIHLGDNPDLKIYHNGSHSFIQDTGAGDLRLLGSSIKLQSTTEENMLVATPNGAVALYHDNSVRFETGAAGAQVTGSFYLTTGNFVHFDNGVTNNYAIRKQGTTLEFKTGGSYNFLSGDADFAGHLKLSAGKALRLYNTAGNAWAEVAFNESDNLLQVQRGIVASSDSALNLGTNTVRWANVYADTLHGDGSNITGVTATDSSKVAKAGDTMTGNLTLNDNVQLRFGTSGAESNIKSDGADTIMTLSSGSFMIGTNGGTPHDNSGKADFVVDINADPQISLYSNQVQVGGTDMNWNSKILYNGTTQFAAWDNDIQIFTQASSGATEKTIWIRPQGTDGTITTRAKFMGDSGVYLYGTTTVAGDIMPSADSTYDIGSNANKWAEGHFDHIYIGETGNHPRIDIYTEDSTDNIADSFADTTTDKAYIYFQAGSGSSDPGYIMHETSDSETNEGVLHLVPSDDNATGDYVSIHGTNDADVLKLHTSGLIETVNLQLQIKSGLNDVYINDNLQTTGNITTTADGTYNIGSNGSRFATGYFDAVAVTNTLTAGGLDINGDGDVSGNLNITGNITNANWQGDTISAAKGGTGLTSISTLLNSNAFANMQSSSADYDTLTTRGLYRFTGGSNGPAGTSHTTGITLTENSGNYGWQMASHSSSNNAEGLYYRYRGTSWGPWQTLVTKTFGDGRYGKIASPTFTGTVTVPDLTVTGNLSITGDINSYNVTDLDVVDKTITIGKGQTEANSGGSGIVVDGSAASLLWDESDNRWEFNKNILASNFSGSSSGTNTGDQDLSGLMPKSGGTMTGAINMGNFNITGVNAISFNDPGPNEGLNWSNTKIYESPNDLTTNTAGNLQFVYSGTRRLTVNNTGIDVNGNITVSGTVDGVDIANHNHDDRYYTESESDAKYLLNTTDTLSGALTVTGDLTVQGVNYGLYHAESAASTESGSSSNYYHDPYGGGRHLSMFLKNARADIIRYRAIDNVEYWNGSSWQDGSSQLANVKKLLDGRQDTSWSIPSTYYKFRFTIAPSTSWPTTAKVGTQTSWTGSTYPGHRMIVEEYDGTSWSTRVTAKFGGSSTTVETTDNNCDNWGWNFISTNQLHTGNGNNTGYQSGQNTRITIDFYGWSPSNSSYTTIPMQNIFITSNFSGTENTDYTNLLDYDRNITTAGAINLGHASDTTIARSAAGKVTIEGNEIYHEGHKPTLAELGAQASGNYITGTGSLSAQDLTDIGNLSGTNTGDQDLSGYVTLAGAQTISGAKTFSVQPTFNADTIHNGHIYGRAVNNESSRLYRFGGLWLTWDSDSYGTNFNHSITSTDNGTYSDSITINSYDKVRINIDSNNNDSASTFSVGKHGTGTSGTLLTLEEDGDLTVTGALSGSNFSGSSSGTNTGDQVSSDFTHDDLTGYVANEHIDWTAENAGTIHASNFSDSNTFRTIKVDTNNDGTVDATLGATENLALIGGTAITLSESGGVVTINGTAETYTAHENISAASSVDNSGNTFIQDITLDSNGHVTFITSAGVSIPEHDNLTGYVANEHIDWTVDASTDIHANNIPDLSGTYLTSLSGAVLTSGAQTVAGTKTFSSAIIANGGVAIQDISDTTITRHSAGHIETPLYRIFDDGYHPNADAWTTARTITLGGDLSGSVSIDGSANVTLTATVANDSHSHSNYITSNANDTVSANTTWNDGNQARFGTGGDLKIQHNGSNAYIDNNTGNLHIRTNVDADVGGNIYIRPHDNEHGIIVTHDSDVKLYHNNSQKFATTSTGVSVTGVVQASGNIGNKGTNIGQTLEYGTSSVATLRFDSDRWRIYSGGSGGAGERFSVLETGNVGVGDSTPSYKLDVAGTIRATGDVIAYSDERVKENIKTIDNSLEKVNKLRGVEFNKIGEDKKSIGVIAQEIEKVLPEVVRTDDEGMKSVAYGNVVGILIEAVKELTKEVEELKKCNKCKNCNCNA